MARKASRKTIVRNLDKITAQVVKLRDDYTCQRCGKKYSQYNGKGSLDWSHVFSRTRYSMRWLLINSISLCCGCHKFWHDNPLESGQWFKDKWPHRYDYLQLCRKEPMRTIRTSDLEKWLEDMKRKLEVIKDDKDTS